MSRVPRNFMRNPILQDPGSKSVLIIVGCEKSLMVFRPTHVSKLVPAATVFSPRNANQMKTVVHASPFEATASKSHVDAPLGRHEDLHTVFCHMRVGVPPIDSRPGLRQIPCVDSWARGGIRYSCEN